MDWVAGFTWIEWQLCHGLGGSFPADWAAAFSGIRNHEVIPGQSWSIFQLQHAFQLRAMTNQVEHNVKVKLSKGRQTA
jgi:hypothetical protein